jgi:hypothetical protein
MDLLMKTETPQLIHRQDYTTAALSGRSAWNWTCSSTPTGPGQLATCNCGAIRPRPRQALQLDGHGLATLSVAVDGQPLGARRLHLHRLGC